MKYYIDALKNFANFRGRATRKEFWMFFLYDSLFSLAALVVDVFLAWAAFSKEAEFTFLFALFMGLISDLTVIMLLYRTATLIPRLALIVRRLHDSSMSGWIVLVGLIPVIGPIAIFLMLLKPSDPGKNLFDLKQPARKMTFTELLKVNFFMVLLSYELSYFFGFLDKAFFPEEISEGLVLLYMVVMLISFLTQLIPDIFMAACWILGHPRLQTQFVKPEVKNLYYWGLGAFFFSQGMKRFLISIDFYLLEEFRDTINIFLYSILLIGFGSAVLLVLTLLRSTRESGTLHKIAAYFFIIPLTISYLWRIANAVFLGHDLVYGSDTLTMQDYYWAFLLFLLPVPMILLVISLYRDAKRTDAEELPSDIDENRDSLPAEGVALDIL